MFGRATSDTIGLKQQEIANLYAQAQVAERGGRSLVARQMRAKAALLESELMARLSASETRTARRFRPPVSPRAPVAQPRAVLRGRLHLAHGPKHTRPRPAMRVPAPRPRKAPGPHNVKPPNMGQKLLPGRAAATVHHRPTEGAVFQDRAGFTPAQKRRLEQLDGLVTLWLGRYRWATRSKHPAKARIAYGHWHRFTAERDYIMRNKGRRDIWQAPILRQLAAGVAARRALRVPGRGAAQGARANIPAGPQAPARVRLNEDLQRRIAMINLRRSRSGLPPLQPYEIDRVRGQILEQSTAARAADPAPDLPLPGTGPTLLRADPRRAFDPYAEQDGGDAPDGDDAPGDDKANDGAHEEEGGFFSRFGKWLLLGALAVGGAYAYSQQQGGRRALPPPPRPTTARAVRSGPVRATVRPVVRPASRSFRTGKRPGLSLGKGTQPLGEAA